jgi:hypothetical protein
MLHEFLGAPFAQKTLASQPWDEDHGTKGGESGRP